MKKNLIFALAATAFLFASCNSKDVVKRNFVKKCKESIGQSGQAAEMQKDFEDYCNCAGDKVVEKFSAAEIIKMEKESEAEMMKKMMPVIQPCINDLQQKVMKNAAEEAH